MFKDKHELLMSCFMTSAEHVKQGNQDQQVLAIKTIIRILPFLEAAKEDQTTVSITLKAIFTDVPTTKDPLILEVCLLTLALAQCTTLFTANLQKLAFIKIAGFLTMKSTTIENKITAEKALQEMYLFSFNSNQELNGHFSTFFSLSLTSEDVMLEFQGQQLQKMSPMIILNAVSNIALKVEDQSKISGLYKCILTRRFMTQQFNDKDVKYFGTSDLPENLTIKDFNRTASVYLYGLLQAKKIRQPMLNQVMFVIQQVHVFLLE